MDHLDGLFTRGSIIEHCKKNDLNIPMLAKFLQEYGELLVRGTGGIARDESVNPDVEACVSKTQAMLLGSQCFGEFLKQFWEEYEAFKEEEGIE